MNHCKVVAPRPNPREAVVDSGYSCLGANGWESIGGPDEIQESY